MAINHGYFSGDASLFPYRTFKVQKEKSTRDFLTPDEVKKIANHQTHVDKLIKVKDIFIFACCTGLRFSDLGLINAKMVDRDGYLNIDPYKTQGSSGATIRIPIKSMFNGLAMDLLQKYDYKLPVISNQKTNEYLKQIAAECGIKKHLTVHVARHTFLTYVAWKTGNVFKVMYLGGLSKIATAQIYVHMAQEFYGRDDYSELTW
jgi:integrase